MDSLKGSLDLNKLLHDLASKYSELDRVTFQPGKGLQTSRWFNFQTAIRLVCYYTGNDKAYLDGRFQNLAKAMFASMQPPPKSDPRIIIIDENKSEELLLEEESVPAKQHDAHTTFIPLMSSGVFSQLSMDSAQNKRTVIEQLLPELIKYLQENTPSATPLPLSLPTNYALLLLQIQEFASLLPYAHLVPRLRAIPQIYKRIAEINKEIINLELDLKILELEFEPVQSEDQELQSVVNKEMLTEEEVSKKIEAAKKTIAHLESQKDTFIASVPVSIKNIFCNRYKRQPNPSEIESIEKKLKEMPLPSCYSAEPMENFSENTLKPLEDLYYSEYVDTITAKFFKANGFTKEFPPTCEFKKTFTDNLLLFLNTLVYSLEQQAALNKALEVYDEFFYKHGSVEVQNKQLIPTHLQLAAAFKLIDNNFFDLELETSHEHIFAARILQTVMIGPFVDIFLLQPTQHTYTSYRHLLDNFNTMAEAFKLHAEFVKTIGEQAVKRHADFVKNAASLAVKLHADFINNKPESSLKQSQEFAKNTMEQIFKPHADIVKPSDNPVSIDATGQPQPTYEQLHMALELIAKEHSHIIAIGPNSEIEKKILAARFVQAVLVGPAILHSPLPASEYCLTFKGLEQVQKAIAYNFARNSKNRRPAFIDWLLIYLPPREGVAKPDRDEQVKKAIDLFFSDSSRNLYFTYKGINYTDLKEFFYQAVKVEYFNQLQEQIQSEYKKAEWFANKIRVKPTPQSFKDTILNSVSLSQSGRNLDLDSIIESMTFSKTQIAELKKHCTLSEEKIEILGLAKGIELMLLGSQALRDTPTKNFVPGAKIEEGYEGIKGSAECDLSKILGKNIMPNTNGPGIIIQPCQVSDDFNKTVIDQEYEATFFQEVNMLHSGFRYSTRMEFPSLASPGGTARYTTYADLRLPPDIWILEKFSEFASEAAHST